MSKVQVQVGNVTLGGSRPFLMAGPCVVEDEGLMLHTAEELVRIGQRLSLPIIFKSSFMKDNRSDLAFDHGPGLEEGLTILRKVKERTGLPILTDVHYPEQVKAAAAVADVLQIPAYLCMQSHLVVTAARTGRVVNLKHGQFLAPENMAKPVKKVEDAGNRRIVVTERGFTFGYNDLVVDPRAFQHFRALSYPVVFDIGHSVRRYGIPSSDPRGGLREFMPVLARAAVGAGVDGLFIETHPDPARAHCDAASQYPLDKLEAFLAPLLEIDAVVRRHWGE
ncbi:MAG TPA: 3-deoxy-8-phosphooctulonate synthase [Anaeromyxobacter sp.]|nr:3-deoxy-8-phosphooctulonate synthase [Anaeromyxobacter sp.]